MLFQALSLSHRVTLDQSIELSETTLSLQKENRTGNIIDYFCSVSKMCLSGDIAYSFQIKDHHSLLDHQVDLSIFMTALLTLPLVNFPVCIT